MSKPIAFVVAALAVAGLAAAPARAQEKTLYQRLGGVHNIAAIVDDFIDRFVKDPAIADNARLKGALSAGALTVPGIKFRYTELISFLAEGLPLYTGSSLAQIRQQLDLTDAQVQAIQNDLTAAMQARHVADADQKDLITRMTAATSDSLADIKKVYDEVAQSLSRGDNEAAMAAIAPDATIVLPDGKKLTRAEFAALNDKQTAEMEGFHIRFELRPLVRDRETMTLRVTAFYGGRTKGAGGKGSVLEGTDISRDIVGMRGGKWVLLSSVAESSTVKLDGKTLRP